MSRLLSLSVLVLIAGLSPAVSAAPADALAYDDSEDLDDFEDDFFEDDSSSSSRSSRKKDRDRGDADGGDPIFGDDEDGDPDFDGPSDDLDEMEGDPDEDLGDDGLRDDPDEGDFGDPDEGDFGDPDDDFGDLGDPEPRSDSRRDAAPKAAAAVSGPMRGLGLKLDGLSPLADNFPVTVVAIDVDAVVVEHPVLVAHSATTHSGEYWLISKVMLGSRQVAEQRNQITAASIADLGPTLIWSRFHVPVMEDHGKIEIVVSRQAGEAEPEVLFTRSGSYRL